LPGAVAVKAGAFCTYVVIVFEVVLNAVPPASEYAAVVVFVMAVPAAAAAAAGLGTSKPKAKTAIIVQGGKERPRPRRIP
jgi:hypothetical protein